MQSRFDDAKAWMMDEARMLRDAVKSEIAFAEKTSYADIVTKYDKLVEDSLKSEILHRYPEDSIVGEESGCAAAEKKGEYVWYIDPIDGTTNFVYQRMNFAISVACFHQGQCEFGIVLDVMQDTMYHACRGQGAYKNETLLHTDKVHDCLHGTILSTPIVQDLFIQNHRYQKAFISLAGEVCAVRSLGSVALELCQIAEGKIGIFVGMRSCPWDHNAAALIVQEAGGLVHPLEKDTLPENHHGPIAAFSNVFLQTAFYEKLKENDDHVTGT